MGKITSLYAVEDLFNAARHGETDEIIKILDQGPPYYNSAHMHGCLPIDINSEGYFDFGGKFNRSKTNAFTVACAFNQVEAAKLLMERGANCRQQSCKEEYESMYEGIHSYKFNAEHITAYRGARNSFFYLLCELGISTYSKDGCGNGLGIAINTGRVELYDTSAAWGKPLSDWDDLIREINLTLTEAIRDNNLDAVKYILSADWNAAHDSDVEEALLEKNDPNDPIVVFTKCKTLGMTEEEYRKKYCVEKSSDEIKEYAGKEPIEAHITHMHRISHSSVFTSSTQPIEEKGEEEEEWTHIKSDNTQK